MDDFHKFSVYHNSFRNPEDVRDYSHYKTGRMKKDDRHAVFVISWILIPRGSNHAQATTEDLYLLKAFKENIQVNWPATISDNMLKVTRLESAMLPYCVFISKILIHFGVDFVDKSKEEEVEGSSSIPYRAKSKFERTILKEMKSLKIMCEKTRDDIAEIKEHLNLGNQNEKIATEEESGGEGSTLEVSSKKELQEEESMDEDVVDECNSDMPLGTYLKKKKKKN
ncbi:hypothetical protein LR48_Vigan07g158900 [Vigna angularis]|uniref:Uncharacterized protein n=1 Tax=Phaseolus angularis TaxID=3914 RepID=A0A0L9UYE7_PHAAN|nr:hypothetical protein LR48_Vigan07g158900 [Vigna angularis]